jgi:restriction system protein
MLLHAKMVDTNSSKGILFSTAPFQRGALRYAKAHNIATVQISDGEAAFRSRGLNRAVDYTSPLYPQFKFTGWFTTLTEDNLESWRLLADDRSEPLIDWLQIPHPAAI